jgi:hypothetical protein
VALEVLPRLLDALAAAGLTPVTLRAALADAPSPAASRSTVAR